MILLSPGFHPCHPVVQQTNQEIPNGIRWESKFPFSWPHGPDRPLSSKNARTFTFSVYALDSFKGWQDRLDRKQSVGTAVKIRATPRHTLVCFICKLPRTFLPE